MLDAAPIPAAKKDGGHIPAVVLVLLVSSLSPVQAHSLEWEGERLFQGEDE